MKEKKEKRKKQEKMLLKTTEIIYAFVGLTPLSDSAASFLLLLLYVFEMRVCVCLRQRFSLFFETCTSAHSRSITGAGTKDSCLQRSSPTTARRGECEYSVSQQPKTYGKDIFS